MTIQEAHECLDQFYEKLSAEGWSADPLAAALYYTYRRASDSYFLQTQKSEACEVESADKG